LSSKAKLLGIAPVVGCPIMGRLGTHVLHTLLYALDAGLRSSLTQTGRRMIEIEFKDRDTSIVWEEGKTTFTAPADGYYEFSPGSKRKMKKGETVEWMESEPEEDEEIEYKIYGD